MPRVLILASFAGSVAAFRGELIREMVARGASVFVCAPFEGEASSRDAVANLGAQPISVSISRTGMNPVLDLIYFVRILLIIWRLRPSHVLAYTIKPVIYGLVAARICGVKGRFALITGLGYAFGSTRASLLSLTVRSFYSQSLKRATLVFFQNQDDERLFRELGLVPVGHPTVVVNGSGIDLRAFAVRPLPRAASFLMIGRLLGAKGVREYAHAARLIRERLPGVECMLAGWLDEGADTIDGDELQSWIDEGSIRFLGKLDDVRASIAHCSVYVLPSYREGTPRTVLEAMAMGRPIITTDVPGCRETVADGENGFLVPARSADALAAAMERLARSAALREEMGLASRILAERKFDVRKVNAVMLREMGFAN